MLARPMKEGRYNANFTNDNVIVAIFIDNSYSNINFIKDSLDDTIADIVNSYNDKTTLKIISLSNSKILYEGLNNKTINVKDVLSISYDKIDISIINTYLQSDKYSDYTTKHLYILTDCQENSFINTNDDSINDWITFIINTFTLKDDLYIENITIKNDIITPNQPFDVEINVSNRGDIRNDIEVELYIDDINVGKNIFSFNKDSKTSLNFKTSIPSLGSYNCYVKLNDNLKPHEDNKYYFNIFNEESSHIAIISDANDSYYLSKVYDSLNNLYKNITYSVYSYDSFIVNPVNKFDGIVVFGYNTFNENLHNKIQSQSNKVLIVPTINNYKGAYLSSLFNNSFYNASLNELKHKSYINLDTDFINTSYLSNLFPDTLYSRNIKIYKYIDDPYNSKTLIGLTNGKSFLKEYRVNNIIYNILTVPLDLSSTNFPLKGTFIPFIKHITMNQRFNRYYYSGDIINLYNEKEFEHINPNKDLYFLQNELLSPNIIGFHKIKYDNDEIRFFSVNINPDEYSNSYLKKEAILKKFPSIEYISNTNDINSILSDTIAGFELWRYILYTIIILVILEMYISNFYYFKNE